MEIICLLVIAVPLAFITGFALTGKLAGISSDRDNINNVMRLENELSPFLTAEMFDRENIGQAVTVISSKQEAA